VKTIKLTTIAWALAALFAFAQPAPAQDETPDTESAAEKEAAAENTAWQAEQQKLLEQARKKAAENAPKVGDRRVILHLNKGTRIDGYLRVLEPEMVDLQTRTFRVAADPDHPKAGLRVWYTSGTNGYIFVPKRHIEKLEIRYTVTGDHRKEVMDKLTRLHVTAVASRRRAQEKLNALKAKQTAARQAKDDAAAEARGESVRKVKESGEDKAAALFKKFSPPNWTPKRKEKILWNRKVLGLAPSQKEQEWLDSYSAWSPLYDAWKKAQDAETKD